jgi:FkbM family methyltransferase
MALARLLSRVVLAPRRVLGLGSEVRVKRGGIDWRLNLEEGIDLAIYLFGAFERNTLRAFTRAIRPGDVVLDIGANIGAHTLRLAEAVGPTGKVLAVEPTQYAFRKLTQLLADNPTLARVVVAKQMLLSSPERLALPAAIYSRWSLVQGGDEPRHEVHEGIAEATHGAEVRTLDQLVSETSLSRVDFIKIDVDGWEVDVFEVPATCWRASSRRS